ncbi:MAG: prepilin peptidase, partial [Comamonas sp.]|nr:prepilin peptidase [Comamonas sp.]
MISEIGLHAGVGGVLGLLIGSFLNVVIHRLPRMMEQDWNAEGVQWAEEQKKKGARIELPSAEAPITLSRPRSRCPHCGHQIAWYENIPV